MKHSPIWHPFTQHAITPESILVESAEGAYYLTPKGHRIFDGISSWWVVTHGHRHPKIMRAIRDQSKTLDQVIFAGFSHNPAEETAEKLLQLVHCSLKNNKLEHIFFSDSGSTAVEVGVKMALGYWRNLDKDRTRIVALEHAYHGDTIGTMSLGMRGIFNAPYSPLLFDVLRLPFPKAENEDETLQKIDSFFKEQPPAALILEPLILGAGGMLIYSSQLLKKLHDIAREHDALVICDEVMTGFGRTGTFLASEQANISPDILCLAKGLTGGSLPLAVTLATKEIFKAHLSSDRRKTFFHSSSYTANPIACAAASANLNIWLEEPVLDRIARLTEFQKEHLLKLKPKAQFKNIRQIGTIAALDLDVNDPGYLSEVGSKLYNYFIHANVLLRPLGNTIYILPPYCSTEEDLDLVYRSIENLPQM